MAVRALLETGDGRTPIQRSHELTLVPGTNSFLLFAQENQEGMRQFSTLTRDLRLYEEEWRTSPDLIDIANSAVALQTRTVSLILIRDTKMVSDGVVLENSRPNTREVRKREERALQFIKSGVFGNDQQLGRVVKDIKETILTHQRRLTPAVRGEVEESVGELLGRIVDFSMRYHQGRSSISHEVNQTGSELKEKFLDFLLSDYSHFSDFADFLEDDAYKQAREQVRPFLAEIAREDAREKTSSEGGLFDRIRKEWLERIKKGEIDERMVDKFILSDTSVSDIPDINIEQRGNDLIIGEELVEWLGFALRMASIIDPEHSMPVDPDRLSDNAVLGAVKGVPFEYWPQPFKEALVRFATGEVNLAVSHIRKVFETLSKQPAAEPVLIFDAEEESRKRAKGIQLTEGEGDGKGESDATSKETERKPLRVAVLQKTTTRAHEYTLLSDEDLSSYVAKQAAKLARGDAGMLLDLTSIIDMIRKNPYLRGAMKLDKRTAFLHGQKQTMLRFAPGKNIGVPLRHKLTDHVRVIYVVDKKVEPPVVAIEGIYAHADYEKVANSNRRRTG